MDSKTRKTVINTLERVTATLKGAVDYKVDPKSGEYRKLLNEAVNLRGKADKPYFAAMDLAAKDPKKAAALFRAAAKRHCCRGRLGCFG